MSLPSLRDFGASSPDPAAYAKLPDDWWLAVADVISSTTQAAAGRDREINFVAGAIVASLSEVLGSAQGLGGAATCQFGGDGAVAAVPPQCREAVAEVLAALAHWSNTDLQIPLRVGMVPVAALSAAGLATLAAVQDFGNGDSFGQFLGPGIIAADRWVKDDTRWHIPAKPGPLPGLEKLSCRWRPISARHGIMLCLIVNPRDSGPDGFAVLARLQAAIEAIAPTQDAGPLGDGSHLQPKLLPTWTSMRLELLTETTLGRRLARLARIVAGSLILAFAHRLGGRLGPVDIDTYRRGLAERSDYLKQAGGPRLVLDVSAGQADAIEALLAQAEAAGEILFGTSRSNSATMTCLVGDFMADRHVHFVDGSGLGFWRASRMLKAKFRQG